MSRHFNKMVRVSFDSREIRSMKKPIVKALLAAVAVEAVLFSLSFVLPAGACMSGVSAPVMGLLYLVIIFHWPAYLYPSLFWVSPVVSIAMLTVLLWPVFFVADRRRKAKLSHMLVLLVAAALLSGCGTIHTLSSNSQEPPRLRRHVYSGVRLDCEVITGPPCSFMRPTDKALAVLDFPFCLVADTLCLPYTIPKAIKNRKEKEIEQEN